MAAEHCPYGPNRRDTLMEWLQSVCAPPWILRQVRQVDAILDRIPPRRWSADALGKLLHVSDVERTMLRIYTIGSYDVPKAKRIKRRKEKRRLADQARRRDNGSKPREQSFSRTKPWEAFGIKRRAWERRGKPMPMTTQIRGQYASLPLNYWLRICVVEQRAERQRQKQRQARHAAAKTATDEGRDVRATSCRRDSASVPRAPPHGRRHRLERSRYGAGVGGGEDERKH